MQPPICFLCNTSFSASNGELVQFLASERGAAWEKRTNDPGPTMPGHHPDQGWFCTTHAGAVMALATNHTINEALRLLRIETSET